MKTEASASNEWGSPKRIVDLRRDRWGGFDLDAAAAPWNAKATRYFTERDDALTRAWDGRTWLNPPYSLRGGLYAFMGYAREQVLKGFAHLVDCLVPAYTCEPWWQQHVRAPAGGLIATESWYQHDLGAVDLYRYPQLCIEVTYLQGRQRFEYRGAKKTKTTGARFSSALVLFCNPERYRYP